MEVNGSIVQQLHDMLGSVPSEMYLPDKLRKLIAKTEDQQAKFMLGTEIKCFELFLNDGHLSPVFEFGNLVQTDISKLDHREIDYITERAQSDPLPVFSARYHHILYLKSKNNLHAAEAILSYGLLETEYFQQLPDGGKCILDFINIVKAGHHLAQMTKSDWDGKRKSLMAWLGIDGQSLFYYQCIAELIATSKLFKRADLKGMTSRLLELLSQGDHQDIDEKDYLEACMAVSKKEGLNVNFLYEMLAESELKFSEKRNDDSGIITANCYLRAALYYKKANNNKKSNQVLKILDGHKQYIRLGKITHQSKGKWVDEAFESLRNEARQIVANTKYSPFVELGISPYILTTSDRYMANKKPDFLDGISTSSYDININVKVLTPYENKMRDVFMAMSMHYHYYTLFLINEIKKLMAENDRDFVAEGIQYFNSTWLKEELQQTILSEQPIAYNWLSSLMPALSSLMALPLDLKIQLSPEQQMAFDQLAIKFEGLLRDLCSLAELTTTKVREERILAQDINELLQNPELAGVFKKDDLELWQFAFTNCGHNIRNNVAHAFYRPKDYTGQKAHLLLLCYIRIAAYGQLLSKPDKQPNDDRKENGPDL